MFSLSALIKARVNQEDEVAGLKTSGEIRQVIDQAESAITNKDSIVSVDFSMPITSTDLLAYLKCPLVRLFKLKAIRFRRGLDKRRNLLEKKARVTCSLSSNRA